MKDNIIQEDFELIQFWFVYKPTDKLCVINFENVKDEG